MVNTSKKGRSIENKAAKELEDQGFRCHQTVRNPIFAPGKGFVGSHNNDLFGVFDVCAARPDGMVMLQVTTGGEVGRRMEKVTPVAPSFPDNVRVEVWGWVGGAKRIDGRFKKAKVFLRRQYWRRFRWSNCLLGTLEPGWLDITVATDGWIDGYMPAKELPEAEDDAECSVVVFENEEEEEP